MVKKHVSVKERIPDYKQVIGNFLDELEVGMGVQHKNLNLYPIFRSRKVKTDLLSLKEALKEKVLEIKETGTVAEVLVINKSKDKGVLLVEGETIKGGAQNRVINTTIIIMPNTREKIPTTCVQQHRWDTFDAPFKDSDYITSHIHKGVSGDVYKKLEQSYDNSGGYGGSVAGFAASQSNVWNGTGMTLNASASSDGTKDIHDAYRTKKEDIDKWMKDFQPLFDKPIVGIVAEIDGEFFADISDTVEFAKTILPQVVKGYCLDAIISKTEKEVSLDEDRIVGMLGDTKNGKLIVGDSPNKVGKDVRIKNQRSLSNIFCFKGAVVHWIVVKA